MLIIAGHLDLDPTQRSAYVAAHADLVARARAAEDCLDLAISADPVVAARVNLFERWESEDHLTAWREVADPPQLDVTYLDGDVQKYSIDDVSPVFS